MKFKFLFLWSIVIIVLQGCKREVAKDSKTVTTAEVKGNLKVNKVPDTTAKVISAKDRSYIIRDEKLVNNKDYRDSILKLDKDFPISVFSLNNEVNKKAIMILSDAGFKTVYILTNGIKSTQ